MASNQLSSRIQIYNALETAQNLEQLLEIQDAMTKFSFGENPEFKPQDMQAMMILEARLDSAQKEKSLAMEASQFQRATSMALAERDLNIQFEKPEAYRQSDALAIAQEITLRQRAEEMLQHEVAHLADQQQQPQDALQQTLQDKATASAKKRKSAITTQRDSKPPSSEISQEAKPAKAKQAKEKSPPKDAREIFAKRRALKSDPGPKNK